MYKRDQAKISKFARANPDNFGLTLSFVIVTIRNRLFNVPADMETLKEPDSADALSGVLYGFKMDSIIQIEREKESLYEQAELINYFAESDREKAERLLALFATIHGLGLVKSGFAAQCIYGVSACLDSHNIKRFGLNPNILRSSRYKLAKTLKTRSRKISDYQDTVERLGNTESLWDSWCNHLAQVDDKTGFKMNRNESPYKSADHVSALHCISLGIA